MQKVDGLSPSQINNVLVMIFFIFFLTFLPAIDLLNANSY